MSRRRFSPASPSATRLLFAIVGALLASGCATAPIQPTPVPVHFVGCSGHLLPPLVAGGDPRVALAMLGFSVGYDVAAYGTCEADTLLSGPKASISSDGVYHSSYGTFSVSLPSAPAGERDPGIDIAQPTLLSTDNAVFRLTDGGAGLKSGAIAFGVGTSEETPTELSEPLDVAGAGAMHSSSITTDVFGQDASTLLHHEMVTLDGRPASFAVYASQLHMSEPGSAPLYLFTYFTRYQARAAAIVIFWQGDCPVCKDGREADLRRLDPAIGRFVDSFHLNEAAITAATAAQGPPGSGQATPAAPTIDVPPGKALIYFYRESHFGGGGLHFHVEEAGDEIGTLPNGTYFHAIVDPGKHTFALTGWHLADGTCDIQIKSGDIRYVQVFDAPNPRWTPLAMVTLTPQVMLACRDIADLDARLKMAALEDAD